MKIGFLGAGVWGFCLASLLAQKGNDVVLWSRRPDFVAHLNNTKEHPFLPGEKAHPQMFFTTMMEEAVSKASLIVEAITSAGLRPVCEQLSNLSFPSCPFVITSKGIEQNTGMLLPEVAVDVLGDHMRHNISCLSGPGYAQEVIKGLPTCVVISAYEYNLMMHVCQVFSSPNFRVYANSDIRGIAYGGALKNIIAIACGMCEGLSLGSSAKAAIMTRGLHEIRKLAVANGCKAETINGLSGMGDLFLSCSSLLSRNCRFGYLLAKGYTPKKAQKEIGTVVEGGYTCVSARQVSIQQNIPMPITDTIYKIIYENLPIPHAVRALMEREMKEEHL